MDQATYLEQAYRSFANKFTDLAFGLEQLATKVKNKPLAEIYSLESEQNIELLKNLMPELLIKLDKVAEVVVKEIKIRDLSSKELEHPMIKASYLGGETPWCFFCALKDPKDLDKLSAPLRKGDGNASSEQKINPMIFQCSLLKGRLEPWWMLCGFSEIFIGLLSNSHLSLRIIEQFETPARYLVELNAADDKQSVSVNNWLNNFLMPAVEKIGKDTFTSKEVQKSLDSTLLSPFLCKINNQIEESKPKNDFPSIMKHDKGLKSDDLDFENKIREDFASLYLDSNNIDHPRVPFCSGITKQYEKISNTALNAPIPLPLIKVRVTHVYSGYSFYALFEENEQVKMEESLKYVNERLDDRNFVDKLDSIISPRVGDYVVTYCPTNKRWLRAIIERVIDEDMLEIHFVDYGHTNELPLNYCRKMPPDLMCVPHQAKYCILAYVNVSLNKMKKAEDMLKFYFQAYEVEIIIQERTDQYYTVLAFAGHSNINTLLKINNYCDPEDSEHSGN